MFFVKINPLKLALAVSLGGLANQAFAVDLLEAINDGVKSSEFSQEVFLKCAGIDNDAGRLACFDALASNQKPQMLDQKRAVNLSSTVKSTFTGKPQVVYSQDEAPSQIVATSTHDSQVLTDLGLSQASLERYTPLSLSFDLDKNSERGLWSARPHNANYLLPMYFNAKPNRHPSTPTHDAYDYTPNEFRAPELKFQLSLKSKALENLFDTDADLWLGYTQVSHWQVYNEDNSRPFRAHDYEPEAFITQPVSADLPWGGKLRMLGAGVVHHSNGESDNLSRSWNRAYVMGGAEWGQLTIMPRVWARVQSDNTSRIDDNPDITDYYGYGDVKFLYQMDKGRNVSGLVRFNPATGKGALQVDYVHPLGRGVSGYVQLFQGYGQSIIDYNHESTSVGVGIMLTDWMGL